MPAEGGMYPPSVYECAYAPKNAAGRGQWQGVNALSTLGELLKRAGPVLTGLPAVQLSRLSL